MKGRFAPLGPPGLIRCVMILLLRHRITLVGETKDMAPVPERRKPDMGRFGSIRLGYILFRYHKVHGRNVSSPALLAAADRRSAWLDRVHVVSIAGALFEPLRQFHVSNSDFVQLLPSVRIVEGLGSGPEFLGARSQVPGL